jgi:hypothetical protein
MEGAEHRPDHRANVGRIERVKALYEDVIHNVVEGLREDMILEGLDESALQQIKQVRACMRRWYTTRSHFEPVSVDHARSSDALQLWTDKLRKSGVLTMPAEPGTILRSIGGGQSVQPPQYTLQESVAASATSAGVERLPPQPTPRAPAPMPGQAVAAESLGMPSGSDMYAPATQLEAIAPMDRGAPPTRIVRTPYSPTSTPSGPSSSQRLACR